jgi:hypothetical protein
VSNPLNDEIARLFLDLQKLEEDLERHLKIMEQIGLLGNVSDQDRRKYSVQFQMRDDFEKKIDYGRQKLISLELKMLDNSIKSLQSTTGQVDGSVKSLKATADLTLRSSMALERSTKILIFATLLLAVIAVFTMSLDLYQVNPVLGGLGILGSFAVIILGFWRLFPILQKKP